jgi:hypothetical protein
MTLLKPFTITAFEDRLARFFSRRPGWCRFLGNLETRLLRHKTAVRPVERPIYVTGLARSGTTILLESLAAHGQTAAHQYRDYPLVAAPLWWNGFVDRAARGQETPVERFHRDGLLVTSRSPEAMEEMLWMMFFPDCHRPDVSHVLDGQTRYPAFEAFYQDHIRKLLLLRRADGRYLSKDNYHVTRLAYLKALFPGARFVIPVREPLAHLASLARQHRLFCRAEQANPRILTYMRNAGHFEFGLDRRPVNTGCPKTAARIVGFWEAGQEARGWALLWKSVYQYVADLLAADSALRAACLVVDYEAFCRDPQGVLARIYDHCGLPVTPDFLAGQAARVRAPRPDGDSPFSPTDQAAILEETGPVYASIRSLAG